MMKKLIALLLAAALLTGAALASEAPPVPQEAKTPAQRLIDKFRTAPEAEAETEEADLPPVEITKVRGKGDVTEITFRNNTDMKVESILFTLLTLNEDGSIATKASSTSFLEFYLHSHSTYWETCEVIKPGKSRTVTGEFIIDWGDGIERPVSVKEYPVVAAGIEGYVTEDGVLHMLASDQMTFVGTDGNVIPPISDDLTPATFSEEEFALIRDLSLGMTSWFVPAYSADFFGIPSGEYIYRVLAGSIPKNAGLRKGDIILAYGDITAGRPYAQEICQLMLVNGEEVTVTYWRNGETKTTTFLPPAR